MGEVQRLRPGWGRPGGEAAGLPSPRGLPSWLLREGDQRGCRVGPRREEVGRRLSDRLPGLEGPQGGRRDPGSPGRLPTWPEPWPQPPTGVPLPQTPRPQSSALNHTPGPVLAEGWQGPHPLRGTSGGLLVGGLSSRTRMTGSSQALAGAWAGEQGRAQLEPSRTSHCTHGGERGPWQIPGVPLGPGTGATWSQVPLSLCPRDPPGLKLCPRAGVMGLPVLVSCGAAHVWGGVCWVERGVCRAMAPPRFLEARGQPVRRVLPSVRLRSQVCGACDADSTEMRAVL